MAKSTKKKEDKPRYETPVVVRLDKMDKASVLREMPPALPAAVPTVVPEEAVPFLVVLSVSAPSHHHQDDRVNISHSQGRLDPIKTYVNFRCQSVWFEVGGWKSLVHFRR